MTVTASTFTTDKACAETGALVVLEPPKPLVVACYGAGTNSTAFLIGMVERGEPVDAILFADTGGERPETYAYVETFSAWLVAHNYPPITVVTKGGRPETLEQSLLRLKCLPSVAYGFKTCSQRFKVEPQDKWLNNWAPAKEAWAAGRKVVKIIGYDMDEPHRVKAYDSKKYENRYPLLEWEWGREECVQAIAAAGLSQPGKSSCFFCPSSTKPEILALRDRHPDLLRRALAIEKNAKLDTVNGLGRRLNWGDFIELVEEAEDPSRFMLRQVDTPMPCGCYDG
jgi:hypothetical protein